MIKGTHHKKESKKKISETLKRKRIKPPIQHLIGEKNPFKRSEIRKRLSEQKKGEKNPNWKGGTSYEPYSVDWTEDLRRAIRKRDRYTCQICGKEPAIHCHHIDYNKKNCNPDNLITLCHSSHSRTNNKNKGMHIEKG